MNLSLVYNALLAPVHIPASSYTRPRLALCSSGALTFCWVLLSARFLSQDLCTASFLYLEPLTPLPIALVNFPSNPALSLAITLSRKAFPDLPDGVSPTVHYHSTRTFSLGHLTTIASSSVCALLLLTLVSPITNFMRAEDGRACC